MTVDMSQFYQTFFEESIEGLDTMESELLNLDVGAADSETINTIFRAAHSIKGGAATFGFENVTSFTHVVEAILDGMRSGDRMVTQSSVNLLLNSVDCLREMLTAQQNNSEVNEEGIASVKQELDALHKNEQVAEDEPKTINEFEQKHSKWKIKFTPYDDLLKKGNDPVRLIRELNQLGSLDVDVNIDSLPDFDELEPEVCYLSWDLSLQGQVGRDQINEVFDWVDGDCDLTISSLDGNDENNDLVKEQTSLDKQEMPSELKRVESAQNIQLALTPQEKAVNEKVSTPAGDHLTANNNDANRRKPSANAESGSIRVGIDKVDALINMVGELVITQSMLGQLGEEFDMSRIEKLRDGLGQLERNTRELQESVMSIRMLPISFAFQRFPRMVRDLSQRLNKKIELKLSGEQTELDKTVMEKIGDPLVHLVRNAIDHGLEGSEERVAKGKPETGVVNLNAYHQGGNIVIEITDDGAGLDKERILAKAKERGLIEDDEIPSDERIYDMIFDAGFSTAEEVSDVSGRGVGMDVVKRNIKELGGAIDVKTKKDEGSTFTIRLPLTLAILDGQLIRVGEETYIIPLVSIIESLQVHLNNINEIAGQAELYKLREEYIPIVRLYDLFKINPDSNDLTKGLLVVVEGDGQRAGLFVDDLLGQQQVVIKSLETNFRRVDGVSGATILGDGTVALILDISGLIHLARTPGNGGISGGHKALSNTTQVADKENLVTNQQQNQAA